MRGRTVVAGGLKQVLQLQTVVGRAVFIGDRHRANAAARRATVEGDQHGSDDVAALLEHLGEQRAVVGGTGLGATITQRTCLEHPGRVRAAILISVEDIPAAAAIGHDRSFRSVDELAAITAPTLVFPGMDERHPAALAENAARVIPDGRLAPASLSSTLRTAEDLADAFAPAIRRFLAEQHGH
ncbi:alpha/beta fold hydrolase [Amycolatopsis sp. WAC 01376]|uniref:alpha/beta fold hydrolase n=1 Tax=Amycolatopsis sp. WAC 01376 TaxID=2203195 RepID=UPI0018F726E2|nr:alpha/beta hydrolase [Amycolatopsis sp. WAC 01376]